ncbi:crotonase/enoyl-CoA hydratase family protein [Gordonia rubripertincta]|uniref:Crotonase/enoyl-CoA hydratase family protein n=2 Tax=Gordonia rubripertincta TaxID=36822 RepID=A0AAW6RCR9_GORRU|nr:crotonase/enoyl-CoA hydratase family protein [Gordonia rubripertincta]ASR03226.1 Carnitinyl-CoA dehydratase [Gordonia rubripertincta]MDG6782008.1 crotonase/enoyl-CoA hydratase family protein [Gordonia rubripertincta]NKY64569.1 crotonase/enoyl-CoA hydratase family protein [Gordonia rubripertincta]GAB86684.1 putative enoyl-CoA hydratase [Gordonia rubripertincta NBRC 101908]
MTDTPESPALIERRGHVMLITMNRPEARNAVNAEMCIVVGDALAEADKDPDVRAVVLTGAGDKAFCAGADLKAITRGEAVIPPGREQWGLAGYVGHAISKPTIAAVNGPALGGGTELVLASDLAVSADTAIFGLPEVTRGLIAGAGGAFRLAAKLPQVVAMELLLTGEPITAVQALELHLINRVVPAGDVLATALALAEKIAANAPLAVAASKRIALAQSESGDRPNETIGWDMTSAALPAIAYSEDAKEGPRAFAEKRPPVWQGR